MRNGETRMTLGVAITSIELILKICDRKLDNAADDGGCFIFVEK